MNLNDSGLHQAMVRWARQTIEAGHVPLDGWYPYLDFGLPQFHHYQSLPHILTAYLSFFADTQATYAWSLYLLLASWPVSVYIGARLLGWGRWTAAAAAIVSPVLVSVTGYGYEHSSYTWRGLGTYSQLWGMWLLPLAWGLSLRAVRGRGSYLLACLALAATVACHFLTGYLALLTILLWVLVRPSEWLPNLRRAAVVGVGTLLIAAWVIVPLVTDSRWAGDIEFYRGTFWFDSYGAGKVLGWLVSGQIYDSGRLPIVTCLVAVGLTVCITRFRSDERARALVGVFGLSLLLFFGRPTLGPLLMLLPGNADLPLHRYINGVHLAGILLAGVGVVWMGGLVAQWIKRFIQRLTPALAPGLKPVLTMAVVVALAAAVLYPGWSQLADYDQAGADLIAAQQLQDATDGADVTSLIDAARILGPGRTYAGTKTNWGRGYKVGEVPVYFMLENSDADAIGMWLNTQSLSSDVEVRFDESNLAQYDLFNIRYLLLPSDRQPSVTATFVARAGRHTLWQVDTTGYLEIVDTAGPPIFADRTNIGRQAASFLESNQLVQRTFPTVAFDQSPAAPATLPSSASPDGRAGAIEFQLSTPADGVFSGTVQANRSAVVLLKSTYDPRWRLTVDGLDVPTQMVAPSFVGGVVPAGRHSIVFRYVPISSYPLLIGLGLITVIGLALNRPALNRLAWLQHRLFEWEKFR
jgi:hypothetical protein